MGIAHDKPPPNALFKATHMFAHARLREAELPSSLGEAVTGGDGSEGLEPNGIEHPLLLSVKSITVNAISVVPDGKR